MNEIKVYTLEEVSDILKVTRRTLYTYIHEGTLPAVKIGKYWRVDHESLQEFISRGTPIANANRRKENQVKTFDIPASSLQHNSLPKAVLAEVEKATGTSEGQA